MVTEDTNEVYRSKYMLIVECIDLVSVLDQDTSRLKYQMNKSGPILFYFALLLLFFLF